MDMEQNGTKETASNLTTKRKPTEQPDSAKSITHQKNVRLLNAIEHLTFDPEADLPDSVPQNLTIPRTMLLMVDLPVKSEGCRFSIEDYQGLPNG